MNQLIQVALQVKRTRDASRTPEEIELALAWLKGEITTRGAAKALNVTSSAVPNWIVWTLRQAQERGKIKIEIV